MTLLAGIICYLFIGSIFEMVVLLSYYITGIGNNYSTVELLLGVVVDILLWPIVAGFNLVMKIIFIIKLWRR